MAGGYPHGLKEDEIPLLPRIIAVADTFDALTTNRPYQQAHDVHEALRIIHSLSGKRLDPDIGNNVSQATFGWLTIIRGV